jgi:hypothetical protein
MSMVFRICDRIRSFTLSVAFLLVSFVALTQVVAGSSTPIIHSRLLATHNYGGSTTAVTGNGNLLYYNLGADLMVADITNPHAPVDLGSWSGQDKGVLYNIHLDGDRLYLPRNTGIEILDVSNSAEPVQIGKIPPLFVGGSAFAPRSIAASGNYAVVIEGRRFRVVDVSLPEAPVNVAYFEPSGNFLNTVVLSGNYAYVGDSSGIHVIDLSSPITPVVVGSLAMPFSSHIERQGSFLYVAASTSVRIVDVSVPTVPVEVGMFEGQPPYTIQHLTKSGDYVFAGRFGGDTLYVINVSNPATPFEEGSVSLPPTESALYANGISVFAGTRIDGLAVVDVANPATPALVATVGTLPVVQSVTRAGNHTFVASGQDLWLLQLPPSTATGVKVWSSSLYLGDITGSGNLLYAAKSDDVSGPGFLEVLDVTNPSQPNSVGTVQLTIQGASRVIVAGEYAYIGSWNGISAVSIV